MYRKSRPKGEQGTRINPTRKSKDKKTKELLKKNDGVNSSQRSGQTSAKKVKRKRDLSTSYIHWGSSKCPNTSETTRVYSGEYFCWFIGCLTEDESPKGSLCFFKDCRVARKIASWKNK